MNIVARAIEEPLRWIANNAGVEGSIVVQRVKEMDAESGFNAETETYENLVEAGVIDPTKVVRYGPGERGIDRVAAADDRGARRRHPRGEEGSRRCRRAAGWGTWARDWD